MAGDHIKAVDESRKATKEKPQLEMTPAQKVFGTYELAEMILLQLNPEDISKAAKVNHTCHQVYSRSIKLCRYLMSSDFVRTAVSEYMNKDPCDPGFLRSFGMPDIFYGYAESAAGIWLIRQLPHAEVIMLGHKLAHVTGTGVWSKFEFSYETLFLPDDILATDSIPYLTHEEHKILSWGWIAAMYWINRMHQSRHTYREAKEFRNHLGNGLEEYFEEHREDRLNVIQRRKFQNYGGQEAVRGSRILQ